jgi:hypothetical protein
MTFIYTVIVKLTVNSNSGLIWNKGKVCFIVIIGMINETNACANTLFNGK